MQSERQTRDDPTGGSPLPPVPPVGPPQKVNNLITGVKVFLIAAIGLALKYAWSASAHFSDFNKLHDLSGWNDQLSVTFHGFVYGLIPGTVLGLLVLLAAFAGPELWSWLGPVILVAATRSMNFLRGMSRAFRGLPENPTPRRSKTRRQPSTEKTD